MNINHDPAVCSGRQDIFIGDENESILVDARNPLRMANHTLIE